MARGDGAVFKPAGSRYWHIRYSVNGRRVSESAHTTDKTAARDQLRRKVLDHRESPLILTKALLARGPDSMLRQYRGDLVVRQRDVQPIDKVIRALERDPLGAVPAARVTTQQVQDYTVRMLREGYARDTIALRLRYIRAALRFGERLRILRQPAHIPVLGELRVREGHFSEAEAEALVQATAYRPSALCFRFLAWYGWRPVEPLRLRWWDRLPAGGEAPVAVLEDPPHLMLPRSKSGRRVLPLDGPLLDLFRELRTLAGDSPWVFPSPNRAHKPLGYSTLGDHFKDAMGAAGLEGRTLYDLKRTAVRRLAQTVGARAGMSITGHKTRDMFDRYDVLDLDDKLDALRRLHGTVDTTTKVHPQLNGQRTVTVDVPWPRGYRDLQGLDVVLPGAFTVPREPKLTENTGSLGGG